MITHFKGIFKNKNNVKELEVFEFIQPNIANNRIVNVNLQTKFVLITLQTAVCW